MLNDNLITEYISVTLKNCESSNEELFEQYTRGDKSAREKLILKNYGMVRKLAFKYKIEDKPGFSIDDLIQEGHIGLMEAIENFKPDMEGGASFIGYAIFWIKQKMIRFMKNKGRSMRIPEYNYTNFRKLRDVTESLESTLMRKPTLKDISKATGKSYDEIMNLRNMFLNIDSLDRSIGGEDDSFYLQDAIPDTRNPYEGVERKGYVDWLRENLDEGFNKHLSLKQREILKARYGLDGFSGMPISEVGELFGLTPIQTKGEVERAFKKLRATTWFVRLKRELIQEDIIRKDAVGSYESVEKRLDRMVVAENNRLKYDPIDTDTAIGESVNEVTSTGVYIRTGIITYADCDQVQIFWGLDGFTVHDPEILGRMVKVSRYSSRLVKGIEPQ